MKKMIALIIALICVYSCQRETAILVHYYYKNDSGVDVKILNLNLEKEIVSIDNGLVYEKIDGAEQGGFPFPFEGAGKIEVIFNGTRSIKYSITTLGRDVEGSPLALESYRVVTIKKKKYEREYEYHYTFTEKQYQDAEPYVPGK